MRNISCYYTQKQIREGDKFVTRRLGWKFLKVGDLIRPIVKGQGLKKGEKIEVIRGPLRVVSVRREFLDQIIFEENGTANEGFPELTLEDFIKRFCKHMKCTPKTLITRIEFEYTD